MNEMEEMERQMDVVIKSTGYQLHTMKGMGTITAATIIADIGDINRFTSADQLAKMAGVAPVSSGKKDRQVRNLYGKRRLNYAFYMLALNHVATNKGKPRNPLMYDYYMKKQKEGRNGKQAMVYVARRLVNIVYSMMKHKTAYRPPVVKQAAGEK